MIIRSNNKKPGLLMGDQSGVLVCEFLKLNEDIKKNILSLLLYENLKTETDQSGLYIKIDDNLTKIKLQAKLGIILKEINEINKKNQAILVKINKYENDINFDDVFIKAKLLAKVIEDKKEDICKALEEFETYNVILDEISRSIDHLVNLDKNKDYYKKQVGGITTFLPLNQPLYATICFGFVPGLMAKDVVVRPPTAIQHHYKKLEKVICIEKILPSFKVSYEPKDDYVKSRIDQTDVVIFTGTAENGQKIYKLFKPKLFILNGAGHNPVVVTRRADIKKAVGSVLILTMQNQGQDCAAPNSILVHKSVLIEFREELLKELDKVNKLVGDYKCRKNIVGPNTEIDHIVKICQVFIDFRNKCLFGGKIDSIKGIIYPTVLEIPLKEKPMLTEFFAPIVVLQPYDTDNDLKLYFEHPRYFPNAMYITVFGESSYVKSLINKNLHLKENILYNTDLHKEERGFMPYGGLGPNASCVYLNNKRIAGATLPQRDIYNYLVKPSIDIYDKLS